jgi:hypothetical protein
MNTNLYSSNVNLEKILSKLQKENITSIADFTYDIPQDVFAQSYNQQDNPESSFNGQDFSIILKFMLNIFRNKLDNKNNISSDKISEIIALKNDLMRISKQKQEVTLIQRFKNFVQSKKNNNNNNERKIITSLFMYITNILTNRKQFNISAMYALCINTFFPVKIDDLFKDFNYKPFIDQYIGKGYVIYFSIFSLAVFLGLESMIIFFILMGGNPSLLNITNEDSASNLIFYQLLFRGYANQRNILPESTNRITKIDKEINDLKAILVQSSNNSNASFKSIINLRINFLEEKKKEKSNIDRIINKTLMSNIESKSTKINQEIDYLSALLSKANSSQNSELYSQISSLITTLQKKRDQLSIRKNSQQLSQQQLSQQQIDQQDLKRNINTLRKEVLALTIKQQSSSSPVTAVATSSSPVTAVATSSPDVQQQPNFLLYLLDNDKLCRILFFISRFNKGIDLSNIFNINPMIINNQTSLFKSPQKIRLLDNKSPLILFCESNLKLKNVNYDVYYLLHKLIMFNQYTEFNFFRNINQSDNNGFTPLFKLINNRTVDLENRIELVKLMLLQKADPNTCPDPRINLRDLYLRVFGNDFLSIFKEYTTLFNGDNWLSDKNRIFKQQPQQLQQFQYNPQQLQQLQQLQLNLYNNTDRSQQLQSFSQDPESTKKFIFEIRKEIESYKSFNEFITNFRENIFDYDTLSLFKYYIQNSNEADINNLFQKLNRNINLKEILMSEIDNKIRQLTSRQKIEQSPLYQSQQRQQRQLLLQSAGSKIILRTFYFSKNEIYNQRAFRAKKPIIAAENAYNYLKTNYKLGNKLISFVIEDRQKHKKYKYSAETKKNGEIILKSI